MEKKITSKERAANPEIIIQGRIGGFVLMIAGKPISNIVHAHLFGAQDEWQGRTPAIDPGRFPLHPDKVYADKGWNGWDDFLGTDKSNN